MKIPRSLTPSPNLSPTRTLPPPAFKWGSTSERGVSGGRTRARAKKPSTGYSARPSLSAFLRSLLRARPKTRTLPPSRGSTTGMAPYPRSSRIRRASRTVVGRRVSTGADMTSARVDSGSRYWGRLSRRRRTALRTPRTRAKAARGCPPPPTWESQRPTSNRSRLRAMRRTSRASRSTSNTPWASCRSKRAWARGAKAGT